MYMFRIFQLIADIRVPSRAEGFSLGPKRWSFLAMGRGERAYLVECVVISSHSWFLHPRT